MSPSPFPTLTPLNSPFSSVAALLQLDSREQVGVREREEEGCIMQGVVSCFSVLWNKLFLLLSSVWSDLGVILKYIRAETQ